MKKILFSIIFLVFISNIALAENINYLGLENRITDFGIHSVMTIEFEYPNTNRFAIPIFASSISNFSYTTDFNGDCKLETRTYGADIICGIYGITEDKRSVTVQYDYTGLIEKTDDKYKFMQDLYMPMNVKSLWYEIILPEGMILVKNSTSPSGWDTTTDGRRIFVFWNLKNMTKGDTFSPVIYYESGIIIESQLIYIIPALVILVGIVIFLWRRKRGVQVVLPVLKEDERKIFKAIMKHGSGVKQKMIVKEGNYSKAKVSKVLKSLEERGLVRLERLGRTNKVHLVSNFEKKK